MMNLQEMLRTSPRYMSLLSQVGIHSPKDFLLNFPRDYEDRATIKTLKTLNLEDRVSQSVKGVVTNKAVLPRGSKKLYEITFRDED